MSLTAIWSGHDGSADVSGTSEKAVTNSDAESTAAQHKRRHSHEPPARRDRLLKNLLATIRRLDDLNAAASLAATTERELLLRLTCFAVEILRRHPVDDSGRCHRRQPSRSGCRRWLRWPTRKAPCLVLSIASFYSTVPVEHVWFQVLPHLGIRRELHHIRARLRHPPTAAEPEPEPIWPSIDEPAQPGLTVPVPTIPLPSVDPADGRHARIA